jgi:putative Mg2+ transporter-C (MgtC) family protein
MDITVPDFWTKVIVAVLCGGAVGLERQIKGKPAGIRTSILICLGTSLFISLGAACSDGNSDPSRVLGQVVTGIGFLGAGVILTREGIILGVTSAAVIWVLAATGAMIGFCQYWAAIVIAFLTLAILIGIGILEAKFPVLRRGLYASSKKKDSASKD